MTATNSGTNILVDAAGVTLANFTNTAASNIKIQDSTITSNAVGSDTTGSTLLEMASGAVAALDSHHTFVCINAKINGAVGGGTAISNMAPSIKGAKLVMTGSAGFAETITPMVGDAQTVVVYRGSGTTWNSIHPGVNIVGSSFFFEGGGDGQDCWHQN